MKKKGIQKRLLATLLAGMMCIGSVQVFPGTVDEVKASEETLAPGERVESTTLFESNFDNATTTSGERNDAYRGSLVKEEGWTAHGDEWYGLSAGGNNVTPQYSRMRVKTGSHAEYDGDKYINFWAEGSESSAILVKHVEGASDFDKVTVEFDLRLEANIGNSNFRFYVGEVEEDNVWSRYLEDASKEDVAHMSQVYWSYHQAQDDPDFDKKVKLVFDILSDDVAEVTTYIGDDTEPNGETKTISLHNGMLNLALAARLFRSGSDSNYTYDEGYLDNVKVTGERVVRTVETTLFESNFDNASITNARVIGDEQDEQYIGSLVEEEGWTAYGDRQYGISAGGTPIEPKNINIRVKEDSDYPGDQNINIWATGTASNASLVKHLKGASAFDKVTVEFDLQLIADNGDSNFYFYVGEVFEDNVWSRYLEDASKEDVAHMSQVYWLYHPKASEKFNETVRLEFDILSDDVAEVTTYIGDSTNPDGEAKYIALHDGMLNLALVTRVSNKNGACDEAYLDDVKVTGTKNVRRKAEVETSKRLLFHSDFESTLDDKTGEGNTGYLSTSEGWDGEPKNLWPHKPVDVDGNDTLKLNMFTETTTSQVGGIYKSVDVKSADKVTVGFKLNMIGDAEGNDLKFAVGSLLKGNNLNYIEQEYWSCDESIGTGWKDVTLEFDMLTDSLAEVTADVGGNKEEPKIVVIPNGELQLGFVANGLKNDGGYNEVYMDNVWVYAEEPITTESVLTNGGEYILFESDFDKVDNEDPDNSQLVSREGWDDFRTGSNMWVRNKNKPDMELNMYASESGEEVQGIFKRIYTKAADKVIVEFKFRMDASAGSDNFKFTVGAPKYNNLQSSIEHEYWSCDKSYHTGSDFTDVKLVFEMLTDTTAKVTAWVGGTPDGEAKVVTVEKGLLNLAFVGHVTNSGSTDEIYMDDVVVTGIKEKHATTVVTESLFDADFETSVSNSGASSLKSEGWDKGSYKFDNNGDGEYDVFPNPDDLSASGTKNSHLNINTDTQGNHSLLFKARTDLTTATSRIQKIIDVTNLDNFVVEFEYQTSGTTEKGSGWYNEFQLVQDPDFRWEYNGPDEPTVGDDGKVQGEVPQHLLPDRGYDQVFAATNLGDNMAKARVEFNVETETVHAYTWNDETDSWELLEGYESSGMQIKDNKVYLTFMYSSKNGGYAYLDNVNIYSVKEAVDGCITDVEGNKSFVEPAMLDGASVRFVEPAGIRFKGRVNVEYIKTLRYVYGEDNVTYGVVIAPYDFIEDEFTIDALGDERYLKIEAKQHAVETDEYYQFNCAMVKVKEKNYGRDYAARTYIEITKADGTTEYVYSDFDSRDNVRSLADVATRALATDEYSDTQKEQLESYSVAVEPLSYGSDIRVMSMNILSEEAVDGEDGDSLNNWEERQNVEKRAPILKSTIEKYNPAVIGIQEYTSRWKQYLSLDSKYEVLDGGETAIIYNSDMINVTAYGKIDFDLNKADSDHTTTWAAMETKAGEKFLFVNTHLDYFKDNDSEGVVASQLNQIVGFIADKKAESDYKDYAVIFVGDFNMGYSSDNYKITTEHGLLDGQDAVLKGLSQGGYTCDTLPGLGKHEENLYVAHGGNDAFDHIFIDTATPVKFKKFSVVVDDDVINLSDHYPLYADIVLNPVQ